MGVVVGFVARVAATVVVMIAVDVGVDAVRKAVWRLKKNRKGE